MTEKSSLKHKKWPGINPKYIWIRNHTNATVFAVLAVTCYLYLVSKKVRKYVSVTNKVRRQTGLKYGGVLRANREKKEYLFVLQQ